MKNKEAKNIITETVLSFLNESQQPEKRKLLVKFEPEEKPEPVMVKKKPIPDIYPPSKHKYMVNPYDGTGIHPDAVNEEEPTESETAKLSPEQKQELEKKIRDVSKNPGLMSFTLGEYKDGDKATVGVRIDPTASGDWSRTKDETLYELPYRYKDDLHEFANEIWQKIQEEKRAREHPPVEINKDDALRALNTASKQIDWYYEMSDDHNVWRAGQERMRILKNAIEKAALVDPEGTLTILKANAPRGWHKWAEEEVARIQSNKDRLSKIYAVNPEQGKLS